MRSRLLCLFLLPLLLAGAEFDHAAVRATALKLYQEGNYQEACDQYQRLIVSAETEKDQVGNDLNMAINCLQQLNRINEIDGILEKTIAVHAQNWRLLQSASQSYLNLPHFGFKIAGAYERGHHRGGGNMVNSFERDRIRSLQLLQQGLPLAEKDATPAQLGDYYHHYANAFLWYRGHNQASWRLQYLTDLSVLPDYDEGYGWYQGGGTEGAPVDAEGNPVFHRVPKSYAEAATDGERWRWLLTMAMEAHPPMAPQIRYEFASFLYQQFGVQTLAQYGAWFQRDIADDEADAATSIAALHLLGDDETVARLATGVKRFKLPDEFNYLKIFQQLDVGRGTGYASEACSMLGNIYQNRRQYPRAADQWRRMIQVYGQEHYQHQLDQIIGKLGQFEPTKTLPAGVKPILSYRFRNGTQLDLEARQIDVNKLLADVKAYLKSNPKQLDWREINIGDLGYRLVNEEGGDKYLGAKVANWTQQLAPRPNHFDRRVDVPLPFDTPGAYLITGQMKDGNVTRVIVWLDDTVITRKMLNQQVWYYVADAVTGQPVAKANVEFFGWNTRGLPRDQQKAGRHIEVLTTNFAEFTDAEGQIVLGNDRASRDYQWLIVARTESGRFAYLGYDRVWYPNYHDQEYNQRKTLVITDRPVYRPSQAVKFKAWVRHTRYDQEDTSVYAGQTMEVMIQNPKGEEVYAKSLKADEYGGVSDELLLPADATLGVYRLYLRSHGGAGTFRVEEYKKPEFEVTIDAPAKPITLGEKIEATVRAKYYFGAPVTSATVKVKVMRTSTDTTWYPPMPWDWFYGVGYWWFADDYLWYPGWREWGCFRPIPWYWHRPSPPPELVAEAEMEIGADGTVVVPIDTALAKAIHGDQDHRYSITAEVTDESRRTIVGAGNVLAARQPFKVYVWIDRGYLYTGDSLDAGISARTPDSQPVSGKAQIVLYKISYDAQMQPEETAIEEWTVELGAEGLAEQRIVAGASGQYRLSATVTDAAGHTIQGGYIFTVYAKGENTGEYRYNALELIPDKTEYAPGEKVQLMVNANQANATVMLFVRPANGVYLAPRVLRLAGKSQLVELEVTKKDMPNFFVEALTIADGQVHTVAREIIVPPEKRVLNVELIPSETTYKPGQKAKVKIKLTDFTGEPFSGSTVVTIYDKSVEYISGGSNVPDIREFFWKWRRHHNPQTTSSLDRWFHNLLKPNETGLADLGVFGGQMLEQVETEAQFGGLGGGAGGRQEARMMRKGAAADGMVMEAAAAPAPMAAMAMDAAPAGAEREAAPGDAGGGEPLVEATVRTAFADTAFWTAALTTDLRGEAEIELDMPENLTTWKVRCWAMGHGTKVGEGSTEVITSKNLIIRLQAPRFFVEKDEVVLSANVHNYLATAKNAKVVIELGGGTLELMDGFPAERTVAVEPNGEVRVDWRVRVVREGEAAITMKALTDEESDAMQMRFPVKVHGMQKQVAFSGHIRQDSAGASFTFEVPAERRIDQSSFTVRYSPTLAGAMVDALPYLVDYPYGCTEQTLNRFVPTVMVQKILLDMQIDLAAVREKRANLNAQELGDPGERAAQWQRWPANPVFDQAEVTKMVKDGVQRLTSMQLSDGGWGWFSGYGEYSYPHTTAVVVHGLQLARQNDVAIVPGVLERGIDWLASYQAKELELLERGEKEKPERPYKTYADALDAFVYMVLVDAGKDTPKMREHLYNDRLQLPAYAMAMVGIACDTVKDTAKRDMIVRNLGQYLVRNEETQTAYLNLGNGGYWWYWYGSEYEAQAYYLKLLARTAPKSDDAAWLVKYLLNNRKHATYWNSTRDTAIVIEAFAEYMRASGEAKPNLKLEVLIDGQKHKEVTITADQIFSFDDRLTIGGAAVTTGTHTVEIRKQGDGPLYYSAYLSYFSLEDYITKAGLQVKVERFFYKLVRVDASTKVAGSHGQAVDQKVEKYQREPIADLATLKSGDLIEVELVIESDNDYEYVVFEDYKAAGFEAVEVRSGYSNNGLGAYMELHDDRVAFFVRQLARGKHSISYRLRAEIPGKFSALPAKAYAMYAPELKGNADEIKLNIED